MKYIFANTNSDNASFDIRLRQASLVIDKIAQEGLK